MRVIIAAAGTGGHINPGIAIANKIMQEEKDSKILFVGTSRGLENDLVPRAGYELKKINAYGFNRRLTIDNISKLIKTIRSIGEAKKIIKEFKPDIVVGTGGYITAVVGQAAKKCKVPVVLHESNAFPGVSIKLLKKKADRIFVGFEDAKERLPGLNNVIVTGTPTKVGNKNLQESEKKKIISNYNFKNEYPTVLVFGGSQGSKSINEALIGIIKDNINNNYNIIWATGSSGHDTVKKEFESYGINIDDIENARIVPYIYNMEEILNAVDLVVCRSGAMTITEISNVGKPAIFIPFPYATANHQEYNARVLEKLGAAKIILDKDLKVDILHEQIESIISNPQLMKEMGENALKNSYKDVEGKIFEEIKKVIKKKLKI